MRGLARNRYALKQTSKDAIHTVSIKIITATTLYVAVKYTNNTLHTFQASMHMPAQWLHLRV